MNSFPELDGNQVSEIASAATQGQDPQLVILERSVLDQPQEPVLGAPLIESDTT
jgi:hypothetical protein